MNRRVFESEVCAVMLANLKISGPLGDEPVEGTTPPRRDFNFAVWAAGTLVGRRMTRASMPKHTREMNPIVLPSYPLRGVL